MFCNTGANLLEHKMLMMPLQRMTEEKGIERRAKNKRDAAAEKRKETYGESWKISISATI